MVGDVEERGGGGSLREEGGGRREENGNGGIRHSAFGIRGLGAEIPSREPECPMPNA
jgi:hypothetical protein